MATIMLIDPATGCKKGMDWRRYDFEQAFTESSAKLWQEKKQEELQIRR